MHAVECSGESLTNLSPYTMIKERSEKDIFVVRPTDLKSIVSAVLFSTELTTWKTGEREKKNHQYGACQSADSFCFLPRYIKNAFLASKDIDNVVTAPAITAQRGCIHCGANVFPTNIS